MALNLNNDNFKETISQDKLVLVDFWAEWCGPCKALSPIIDELSQEMGETMTVAKVDITENQDIAVEYGVRNIPTMLFFRNGEIVDKQVGAMPKSAIQEIINKHLNKEFM
jgi:thioredoxin 1